MTAGRSALSAGRKLAPATVNNRTQSPFFVWLRDKLLAVHRQSVTPPPGLPDEDGKVCSLYETKQLSYLSSAISTILTVSPTHKLPAAPIPQTLLLFLVESIIRFSRTITTLAMDVVV